MSKRILYAFNISYGLFSFEVKSIVICLPFHFRVMDIQEFTSVAEMLQLCQHFIPLRALQLSFSNLKFLMKILKWVLPIRLQVSPGTLCSVQKICCHYNYCQNGPCGTSGLVNMSHTQTS